MALLLWKKSVPMRRLLYFHPISHSKGFSCSSGDEEIRRRFDSWASEHGKSYNTVEEKEKRFEIFRERLRSIEALNSQNPNRCKMKPTQFSDLTWNEIEHTYYGIPIYDYSDFDF